MHQLISVGDALVTLNEALAILTSMNKEHSGIYWKMVEKTLFLFKACW